MLTLEGFIAVISLCITAYGLGYSVGYNNAKNNRPSATDAVTFHHI